MDNENGGWLSGFQIGNAVFEGENVGFIENLHHPRPFSS